MLFRGTLEAVFGSILTNNKVNMSTGTNWLNSLVNIAFKMYNLWELNITHPFLRLDFLQPGKHYPKMSTKNIEVEMREKKIYVFYFRLSALDYYFFFIRNNPLLIIWRSKEIWTLRTPLNHHLGNYMAVGNIDEAFFRTGQQLWTVKYEKALDINQ